jgi:G3E family GTPase
MLACVINGFLGSGKTTFILNILKDFGGGKRIVVLVNELGEVGIDGSLIKSREAEVVELANGCICCSLTADLKAQIIRIKKLYNPDLLLIEPTGAASIQGVLRILDAPGMEEHVEGFNVLLIIDAQRFLDLYIKTRFFMEGQIRVASFVVINKCDKVPFETANLIKDTVLQYNSAAQVFLTRFGQISLGDWESFLEKGGSPVSFPQALLNKGERTANSEHSHDFDYSTFSWVFDHEVEREGLQQFLEQLPGGHYGAIVRIKGLVRTTAGWFRIDYVPREFFWEEINEPDGGSRLFIIGTGLENGYFTRMLKDMQISHQEE